MTQEMRKFLMHFTAGHMLVANVWHLEAQAKKLPSYRGHEFNSRLMQETLAMYRLASGRQLVRRIEALSPPPDQWGLGDVVELTPAGWEALGLENLMPSADVKKRPTAEETKLRRRMEAAGKLPEKAAADGPPPKGRLF